MIEMHLGQVKESWWRRKFQLKPQTWLYIQHETGYRQPVARFIPGMDKYYWLWMDEQAEQLATAMANAMKEIRAEYEGNASTS